MQNSIRGYILAKLSNYPLLLYLIQSMYRFILLIVFGSKYTRKFFLLHDKRLIYVNNPKVACSSIKTSLIKDEDISESESIHSIIKKTTEVRKRVPKKSEDYYKFTFVRNPYSRLISCYNNKVRNEGTMKSDYFKTHLFGYVSRAKSFNDFIVRVCKIPHRLAEPHLMSQFYLLHDKNVQVVDFIGKLENINEEFTEIQEKYELKPLNHYNKTINMNWMDYYTLETAELVYKKYKNDFIFLGYEQEYTKLINYLKNKCEEAE